MAIVWTVTPVHHEIATAAAKWGEIRSINQRYCHKDELRADLAFEPLFMDRLREAAATFDHPDYLLISGDHAQLVQFTAFLAIRMHQFKVLRFDRRLNVYYPVLVMGRPKGGE